MSSRERRNRPQRAERDTRVPSRNDQSSSAREFSEDFVGAEEAGGEGPGTASGRRAPGEGTAEQISRLRQSMSRGTATGTPQAQSKQSIGRNYLSRSNPQPAEPAYDDDDDDVDQESEERFETRSYRPDSRRRDDVLRQDPYVTQDDAGYSVSDPSAYDDDDDEPYYEDDDDFSEYDAPRGSGWQRDRSRSGDALRQPGSRPSLPPAIAQADLVNDAAALSIIGIGLLSLAAMAILVANRADSLAPTFPTHVSASGVLEDFRSSNNLWRLPLLSTMLTLMNIVAAWFISPLDRFASRFLLAAAVVVQLVAWVALIRIL